MSYILDALKQSDKSRQLNTTHEMSYSHLHTEPSHQNLGLKIAVVVLSLIAVSAMAYTILLNKSLNSEQIEVVEPVVRPQSTGVQSQIPVVNNAPAQVQNSTQTNASTPVAEQIEIPKKVQSEVQDRSQPLVAIIPVETQAPTTSSTTVSTASSRSSLSDLTSTPASPSVTKMPAPVRTQPVKPAPAASSSVKDDADYSLDFTGYENYRSVKSRYGLPDLHLDILMFHPELQKRKAYINMNMYKQGETTSQGAEVMKIGKEGVLLRYSGHQFVLTTK